MARWRHAVELAMTDEAIGKLTEISRSRTEAASRVARAQMPLRYAEKPSFFAVGERLGVHHQTVQRCVERALAYGALAALDDRPRLGKEPTITPEAKAWLVSLACDKAKEHSYAHELWTTRLFMRASTDRRRGTNASPSWCKAQCARSSAKRKSSLTRCATIWNAATPSSSRRWRNFCVSTARFLNIVSAVTCGLRVTEKALALWNGHKAITSLWIWRARRTLRWGTDQPA
jgi:transposase